MSQFATFDDRLRHLVRKHERIRANGYVGRLTEDGLVVMVPRRRGPTFPRRGLIGVLFAALAFKAYLLASLGTADYAARVDMLSQGTPVERAGAWIMAIEPATQTVADLIAPLM